MGEEITAAEIVRASIKEFFRGRKWFGGSVRKVPKSPIELREIYWSIKRFFQAKNWHCGGPIPPELLHTRGNWELLTNIDLISAVKIGYYNIQRQQSLARTKWDKHVDIRMCLRVLRECEKKGIPQNYLGGIFLMYLQLCERVELLPVPRKVKNEKKSGGYN